MEILSPLFRRALPAIACLAFFASCEKEANIPLPEVPPKLVLNGFICPQDDTLKVSVRKSSPIFELQDVNVYEPVPDATVRIFGNSTSIQLTYDPVQEVYTAHAALFPVVAGAEYRIEASAPGVETATATTSIPAAPPADFAASMTYTIDSSAIYNWHYEIDVDVSFTDLPADGNLYRVMGKTVVYDSYWNDTLRWAMGEELLQDRSYSETAGMSLSLTPPAYGGFTELVAQDIYLMHCSREYFLFHQALFNYSGGDDPFSEPTIMYSNVTGGYGIFAGANYSAVRLYF